MCVELPKVKLVYMPIPKAACTSVKAALSCMDEDSPISAHDIARNNTIVHKYYGTSRFRPHRWQKYCDGTWWRFCVVRDPLKRLMSVYSNRVVGVRELHNSPRLRAQSKLPPDPDPDFFFQNIREYMSLSSVIKHHALPSHLFIGPKPIKFDRVYRTSEIGNLETDLSERAGREIVVPKFNRSEQAIEIGKLAPQTIVHLGWHLKEEYDHLSAYFPNPFRK